jgi:Caspase domain
MPVQPNPELSRAVLIGTSDFQQDELTQLPAVRNNLTDLAQALTDPVTGILTWEQCTIVDSPDSPDSFMSRLERAAAQAEDLLLVYYAGHGIRHETRDDLYLTVRESNPRRPTGSAVPFAWVRDVIEQSRAESRLLILDCCYSGMALGAMSGGGVDQREIAISGTSVITSSPKNKISLSPPGERNTAFTAELITLLVKGSRREGEPLSVNEVFRSLQASLARRDLPQPKMKSTDTGSDLILRRQPPPKKKPAPPKPAPLPVVTPAPKPVALKPESTPPPVVAAAVAPRPPKVDPPKPKPPVYLPPVQYEPPRMPVSFARPPVDPPTVRTRPVPKPPIPAAAVASSFAGKELAAKALTGSKWTLSKVLSLGLGACLHFGGGFAVGGFIGAIFAPPLSDGAHSDDLSLAIGASVFALVGGLFVYLRWRKSRSRKGGRASLADVFPDLAGAVGKTKTVTLWIGVAFSVGMVLTGFFANPVATPSTTTTVHFSDLSTNASMIVAFFAIGARWGFALFKRYRTRPVAAQVSQPGLELNG